MATKKLQDLTASASPNDTDILLIEDTSATKKITFLSLFNKIKTKLGLGSLATKNKVAQSDMETAVGDLLSSIGKASDLTTTQKANLVVAINELVESTNSLNRNIDCDANGSVRLKSDNIAMSVTKDGSAFQNFHALDFYTDAGNLNNVIRNMLFAKTVSKSVNLTANTITTLTFDFALPDGKSVVSKYVEQINAANNNEAVILCFFVSGITVAIKSTVTQSVTVKATCLYK